MSIIQLSNVGFDAKRSEIDVIKTNFLLNAKGKKVIAVLSSAWSETVPTLTVQLAKSFALGQRKVLLINTDAKNRMFLEADFLQNDDNGLFDFLLGQCSIEKCIYTTDVPGLSYLPIGSDVEQAVDLLGGIGFEKLLLDMKEKYDMVFLLVPAVADSTDGITAAKSTEGCVIIVDTNTAYKKIAKSVEMLKKGAPVIGTVLIKNQIPWKPSISKIVRHR